MKFTKQQNRLIRAPGGKIATRQAKEDIILIKQFNPSLTYAQISKEYYAANKKEAARYRPTEKDFQGQFISRKAEKEINEAAAQLKISRKEAKEKFLKNKLVRSELGNTPLHTATDSVQSYAAREKDFKIRLKLPGDKRYRVFKNVDRAMSLINKEKARIYKEIRERTGQKLIPSDEIPTIPMIEKYTPGQTMPKEIVLNFNDVRQMHQLDDDEHDEILDELL